MKRTVSTDRPLFQWDPVSITQKSPSHPWEGCFAPLLCDVSRPSPEGQLTGPL